ncbi:MAG: tRNA (N6-isopentenyl adenosine(37)-C2)-methylthiotransferase MiaB [Chloroflexota bacterium]
MNYHFWIIGCQMNVADSERIARALNEHGHRQVGTAEDADVVLLTSCTVRQGAEDRLWGELGKLGKLKKARPDLVVGLTGCVADGNVGAFMKKAPVVDLYINPRRPEELLTYLADRGLMDSPDWGDLHPDKLGAGGAIATERVSQAVARYVPVIYGCNYNCTYCIVPYTRGVQDSRKPEEILEESRWLLAEGAKEIVLLGQTVDAYGEDLDPPTRLSELLQQLHELPGLERIRFLTSHPNHMTHDLIEAVAALPKVMEHINLPFQAGDDAVLKRMARRYKAGQYRALIDRIKERIPNAGLSTDVIVGFSGETEEQFERTLDMLRYVRFDVCHVAAYSPRKATPSERLWEDDVPRDEKKRRLHAVERLQAEIATERNAALEGSIVEVLVEGPSERKVSNTTMGEAGTVSEGGEVTQRWGGRTRTNKLAFFDAPHDPTAGLVKVLIEKSTPWFLEGQLLTPAPVRSRRLPVLA